VSWHAAADACSTSSVSRPSLRALSVLPLLLALGIAAAGCKKRTPDSEPPRRDALLRALTPALAAAAGDLNGDGRPELIMVDARFVRVLDLDGKLVAETAAPSGIQLLASADLDGDGRAEILAGWGSISQRRTGRPRFSLFRLAGAALTEEVLLEPETERPDVVAILPHAGALVIAWFESKYMVRIESAQRGAGGWTRKPLATIRMATSLASGDVDGDGQPDLVVGRVYGDAVEADGDAFVLRAGGQRIPIPITGGVRALCVFDLDGDRRAEVLIGDGWNRDYGKLARGLLTKASYANGSFATELIDDGAGQYTLGQIFAADLDGDGRPEIVTRGNSFVRVLRRAGNEGRWSATTVGTACPVALAADLDPRPGLELFTLCEDGAQIRKP
jgi:hypothetical protein